MNGWGSLDADSVDSTFRNGLACVGRSAWRRGYRGADNRLLSFTGAERLR